jgi:hypothetical protein
MTPHGGSRTTDLPGAMEEGTRHRALERRKISVDRMSYKDGDAKHT